MKPKVYFNDQCSICKIEINHYKSKCDAIEWKDIHNINNIHNEINKEPKQLIRRLHVFNDGELIVGVDAMIFIWSKIQGYKYLSTWFKIPIIYHMAFISYEIIAFLLYLKNYRHIKTLNKKYNLY